MRKAIKPVVMFAAILCVAAVASAAGSAEMSAQIGDLKAQTARTPSLIMAVLQFCLMIALLSLWRAAREYKIFFWTGLYFLIAAVVNCARFAGRAEFQFVLRGVVTIALAECVVAAFGTRLKYWRYVIWPIGILDSLIHVRFAGWPLPTLPDSLWLAPVPLVFCAVLSLLAIWRGPAQMRVLGCFLVLFCFTFSGSLTRVPLGVEIGGWQWFPTAVMSTLFGFMVLQTFVRQLTHDRREKMRLAGEFEAARAVQRLLLRDDLPTPGLRIEKVYAPAQEVGGDFYQVLPAEDGSVLVVVGDVSGKGLKAAMQVSLIVGSLRDNHSEAPAHVMAHLNRVLYGQTDGGFVTCLCARVAGSELVIANAGHLSPYLAGVELEIAGGLPLGIVAEALYEETRFTFAPGERLTFLSDGVAEARNKKGELLGFERTRQLSAGSAAEIALAAQTFGQDDDITVLTIERLPHFQVQ